MNRSLFALMLSSFALGLSEFMPMGLLPAIAKDLQISLPKAGMLVTAYAAGVMIASPIITIFLSSLSKKKALIILLMIFTAGSIFSFLSEGYKELAISRIITSLSHGSFFGIGAVLAIKLAPEGKKAGAVSLMFMGLTIANIGGVPAAALIGETFGWRTAFAGAAVLGVISSIILILNIPAGEKSPKIDLRGELTALIQPRVLIIFAGTAMFSSSLFTLYTYIAPVLGTLTEATPAFTAAMLSLIGIGFTIGGFISGKMAINWSIDKAIILSFFSAAVIMFIYPLTATTYAGAAAATLLWSITGYASSPLLQTKIVSAAKNAPALASSVNIGVFNLGNAIGAFIGGGMITAGLGYGSIPVAGGIISVLGALTVLLPVTLQNRKKEPCPVFHSIGTLSKK